MSQSKIDSILEALTNIAIGASIALIAQLVWFPILDKQFTLTENIATTAFFTLVSFARSYWIRRAFDGKSVYQSIKKRLAKKAKHHEPT